MLMSDSNSQAWCTPFPYALNLYEHDRWGRCEPFPGVWVEDCTVASKVIA